MKEIVHRLLQGSSSSRDVLHRGRLLMVVGLADGHRRCPEPDPLAPILEAETLRNQKDSYHDSLLLPSSTDEKQTQKDCLCPRRSMYRFPDSIFQRPAAPQAGPSAAWALTFRGPFPSSGRAGSTHPPRLLALRSAGRKTGQVSHYLLEGLFSSVGADVVVEGGGPGKGTATVAALERPVTGVSDHVVPQF